MIQRSGGRVLTGPLPLRFFSILLVVGSHFAIWLGSSDAWWRPKEWWVFCVLMAYFAWRLSFPPQKKRTLSSFPLAALFGFICVQTVALFVLPAVGARGSLTVPIWPWIICLHLILILTWFKDAVECLDKDDLAVIWKATALCGTAIAALMILQFLGHDPVLWVASALGMKMRWLHDNHVVGLMGNSFQAACVLAPALPLMLALGWILPAALAAIALFLTGSASATAAAACGSLAVLWLQRKRTLFWSLCLVLISSAAWTSASGFFSFSGRLELWNKSLSALEMSPWLGHGLGTYKLLGITATTGNGLPNQVRWAHNEYLQIGVELGLIGLGILVFFLTSLIRREIKSGFDPKAAGVLVALSVLSVASIPFHLAPTIVMGLIALSETIVTQEENRSENAHA